MHSCIHSTFVFYDHKFSKSLNLVSIWSFDKFLSLCLRFLTIKPISHLTMVCYHQNPIMRILGLTILISCLYFHICSLFYWFCNILCSVPMWILSHAFGILVGPKDDFGFVNIALIPLLSSRYLPLFFLVEKQPHLVLALLWNARELFSIHVWFNLPHSVNKFIDNLCSEASIDGLSYLLCYALFLKTFPCYDFSLFSILIQMHELYRGIRWWGL